MTLNIKVKDCANSPSSPEPAAKERHVVSDETRRRMSESAKRRCTPEERERRSLAYRMPLNATIVCRRYTAGETMQEIADDMGVSRKPIDRLLKREGVLIRKAAKRNQWGAANDNWRGDNASLAKLHRRLDRRFGTPKKCEVCGTTDPGRTYDWANLMGDYTDIRDYQRMCRSCHWKRDETHKNFGGMNV